MANRSITIPKAHLIMALCLPLAVLLGYMLAEPMDGGTFAIVTLVLAVLAVPLLMNWYHPMLILAWNCYIVAGFLPGQPQAWMIMAPVALLFAVLNRAVNPEQRFISVPSITRPLLFFLGVLLITAWMTGGIGLRSFGGSRYGSRSYFYMVMAIAGYFALTSQRIPLAKAPLFVALFFLTGLTSMIPHLLYYIGPPAYPLFQIFPVAIVNEQINADTAVAGGIFRLGGLSMAGPALYCFLLASYGVRGILDLRHPWKAVLFVLALLCCLASGYRSAVLMALLTFTAQFFFEGLHRTRLLPVFLGLFLCSAAILLPVADRLPMVVQRSLTFLPIKLDTMAEQSAYTSSQWRLDMWKALVPEIPRYLFKGKGYAIDPNEAYLALWTQQWGNNAAYGSRLVGDYHSGPLSVIIPLGVYGVIGFSWFIIASCRMLYRNLKQGDPNLKNLNTLLLAAFVAKTVFFLAIFGSLYSDLYVFTGLVGLSVSLNGSPEKQVKEEAEPEAAEAFV